MIFLQKFTKSASEFGDKIKDSLVVAGNKLKDATSDLTAKKE